MTLNCFKNLIFIFCLMLPFYGQSQHKRNVRVSDNYIINNSIDINNIVMWFNNQGTSDGGGMHSGGYWNVYNESYTRSLVFDQGPWLVGKKNGEIVLAGVGWNKTYSPGPIVNGHAAILIHPEDSLQYRIYKINKGDDNSNPDYAEWPVNLGAPITKQGRPLVFGDQTLWTSYNYLDSTLSYPFYSLDKIDPLELEIHQTVFARGGNQNDINDLFSNVIFMEWEIIYKGDIQIDSAYFGFWCDIDFEPFLGNYPAVDTILQTGYCWTNEDTIYAGRIPLAVGYTLLYGPVVPDHGNNATFNGKLLSNYRNLPLTSFRGIGESALPSDDSLYSPVKSIADAWNFARGYNDNGNPYWDSIANKFTSFPFSGDPVTNEGWLFYKRASGGESGFMLFSGPFNMAANDTQWVMIALVPGLGNSNLNSIEVMRENVMRLRALPYDSLAILDEQGFVSLPERYYLYQNYPNPFNPVTTIRYELPQDGQVTIDIFDILGQRVKTLLNEYKQAGRYELKLNSSGLASGVYIYQLRVNEYVTSKKMVLLK